MLKFGATSKLLNMRFMQRSQGNQPSLIHQRKKAERRGRSAAMGLYHAALRPKTIFHRVTSIR